MTFAEYRFTPWGFADQEHQQSIQYGITMATEDSIAREGTQETTEGLETLVFDSASCARLEKAVVYQATTKGAQEQHTTIHKGYSMIWKSCLRYGITWLGLSMLADGCISRKPLTSRYESAMPDVGCRSKDRHGLQCRT